MDHGVLHYEHYDKNGENCEELKREDFDNRLKIFKEKCKIWRRLQGMFIPAFL